MAERGRTRETVEVEIAPTRSFGTLSLLLLLASVSPAQAADEVAVFSVELYGEPPMCCPDCTAVPWLHQTNDVIADKFDEWTDDLVWDVVWQ